MTRIYGHKEMQRYTSMMLSMLHELSFNAVHIHSKSLDLKELKSIKIVHLETASPCAASGDRDSMIL